MKRLILSTILCLLFFASCTAVTEGVDRVDALNVTEDSIDMDCEGGQIAIEINSLCKWKIDANNCSWISTTPEKSHEGKTTVTITLQKNLTAEERSGIITIRTDHDDIFEEIAVHQGAHNPFINISDDRFDVDVEEVTKDVTIESNIQWTAICDADWVTLSTTNGGFGTSNLKISISQNIDIENRETVVIFKNETYNIEQQIDIVQSAFNPFLTLSDNAFDVDINGASLEVAVDSNISWSATCDAEWVDVSPTDGDVEDTSLSIIVAQNIDTTNRNAVVKVTNDYYNIAYEITIAQKEFEPYIKIGKNKFDVDVNGGMFNLIVDSNISWTATCNDGWVALSTTSGTSGVTTIDFTVNRNINTSNRDAVIKIKNDYYDMEYDINISQKKFEPYLNLDKNSSSFDVDGGNVNISINSNVSWVASCDANWVTVSPTNGVAGSSSIDITVAPNANTNNRSAVVKVINEYYNIVKEIAVSQKKFEPYISVSEQSFNAAVDGGSTYISVDSNIAWTANCDAEWVTLSTTMGAVGVTTLKLDIAKNANTQNRSAIVQITGNDYNVYKNITVSQHKFEPFITISEKIFDVDINGGTMSINIDSNIAWTATNSVDWVTLSTTYGTAGSTVLKLTVAKNIATQSRSAIVKIVGDNYNVSYDISISQKQFEPYINLGKNSFNVDINSALLDANIDSNVSWTASCAADWVTLSSTSGNAGSTSFKFNVDKNIDTSTRSAVVKITNTNYGITKEINITQSAFAPYITLSNSAFEVEPDSKSLDITIDSNISWTVTNSASWITLSSNKGEAGTSTLTLNVSKNSNPSSRNAVVKVTNDYYGLTYEINVKQNALDSYINLSKESYEVDASGSTLSITVSSNISWTATTTSSSWVTVSPSSGSTGSSTLKLTVSKNANTTSRKAVVKVKNDSFNVVREIAINQKAFEPYINVNSKTFSVGVDGASLNATVSSNVSWTATSDASWVTLSPSSGSSGSTTLKLNVAENTNATSRSATIQVKNSTYNITQEITVTQSAFVPYLTLSKQSFDVVPEGATLNITIDSNASWTATSNASWVTLSETSGNSGSRTITLNVANNDTGKQRTCNVVVSNKTYQIEKTITINQDAIYVITFKSSARLNFSSSYFGAKVADYIWENGIGTIYFEEPVTTISGNAFYYSEDLLEIVLPNSVTTLIDAFSNCRNLKSVTLGDSVTTIGERAFSGCAALTNINIPNSVKTIGERAFSGCAALTNINIPNSVKTIGERAFYDCTSLTGITIPDSVTMIDDWAFYNCNAMTNVSIGANVKTIGDSAFDECKSLTTITLPKSVTTIEQYAFHSCPSLTSVYCRATTPPTMGNYVFLITERSKLKIYVPTSSVAAYKAANIWSDYADYIVGYNF